MIPLYILGVTMLFVIFAFKILKHEKKKNNANSFWACQFVIIYIFHAEAYPQY